MSSYDFTIFKVDGVAGDTLPLAGTLEGTVDHNYVVGDVVEMRMTAGYIGALQAAVNGLEVGGGGGAVSSVFTRTGAVVAAAGDYGVGQVSGCRPWRPRPSRAWCASPPR